MTATNTYGRQVVLPLTNKSGGSVAAGDVVIVDTSNNDAFTTTTSGATTAVVGVAQETIANNATGRVLLSGYAALVNVNASVTRGHYGATHTVAKQATDSGTSRAAGSFCQFLTGGTTPDAMVWPTDLGGGSGMTNPMTTKGDIITGDTGGTPTRLAAGATSGMVLTSAGAAAFPTMSLPPGYEFDYVQSTTAATNITATTEATANTIVTGNAVTYDGSTIIMVEFWCVDATPSNVTSRTLLIWLYDGSTSIGAIGAMVTPASVTDTKTIHCMARITPSAAAHTYSIRGSVSAGTGILSAGAGGNGNYYPLFIRQYKVK